VAVAVLCPGEPGRVFEEAEIDEAWGIANVAAPVIDNALRHRKIELETMVQERDRLSRELHDNLAQTLGTLNVLVSVTSGQLSAKETEQAQATLREMGKLVQAGYADVREAIFNLREPAPTGPEFVPALAEYMDNYRTHYGIDAHLVQEGKTLPELPANTQLQLMRIVQEALANVRKHAQVHRAEIHMSLDGAWVEVRVEDRGVGFDPVIVEGESRQHYGLRTMRERAESVGGELTYSSKPGEGTKVVVRVPH
jgi:signal transduction histidine kinase